MIGVSSAAGGGNVHLFALMKHLISKGFKVSLIIPDNGIFYSDFEKLGIVVYNIDCRKLSLRSFIRLIFVIKQTVPDLIHTHGKGAGLYGRLSNILFRKKSVHTFHGFYLGNETKVRKLIFLFSELVLRHFTDQLIAVSKGELSYLKKIGIFDLNNTKLIYNGVEKINFSESKSVQNKNRPVIGTFSRIDYAKGIDLLVQTVIEFQKRGIDAEFHILGGTPKEYESYYHEILEITKQNNWVRDRLFFQGEVSRPHAFLQKFDIYLCTSRREGFPLALLEAALSQKLIVSTNVCGCNEIVEDEVTGFLAKGLTPEHIADAIERALNSQKKQQIIDQCFQKVCHDFSLNKMLEKTCKLYTLLLQDWKSDRI